MKQVYLIPNMITAFALSCGLFVIFKVVMAESDIGIYELLQSTVLLILVAALADLIDGAVARIMHAESEFGVMFDSLADAVSFGVAPAVLFLKSVSLHDVSSLSLFAIISAMLYSICGVLRLVRFNVKAQAIKGDIHAMHDYKKNFTGLPIPAAAMTVISTNCFLHSSLGLSFLPMQPELRVIVLSIIMIVIGYFMISKWKFLSLKTLRIRVSSVHLVFLTAVIAIFLLYGLLYHFALVFTIICWGYLLTGCLLTIIRLIAGRKSQTLQDFEPENDEID